MFDKFDLIGNLTKQIANVTFTKADGSIRNMRCTLMREYLPIAEETTAHVPRRQNDEVLAVWDLDNQGWRSFRLDSIQKVEYGV